VSGRLNVLLIDNFDSFTFNLVDELRRSGSKVDVWRNDIAAQRALDIALALPAPRLIVLSPGPGRPEDAGCCQPLVQLARGKVPLFGVCLGLQAIVQALGGKVDSAGEVVHGKSAWIEHDGSGMFTGLSQPLQVGRYHSLVARDVPTGLEVVGRYRQLVMALMHREDPIAAVQFHPESILTPQGSRLLANVGDWAAAWDTGGHGADQGGADA